MLSFNDFLIETQNFQLPQLNQNNNQLITLPEYKKTDFLTSTKNQMTRKHNYFYKPQQSGISSALLPKY